MHGLPSFPQDEGAQSKSSDRVSPGFIPDGVHHESRKNDPCHVTADGRFGSVGLQSGA